MSVPPQLPGGRPEDRLPPAARRRLLLDAIRANGSATIAKLVEEGQVSAATVHRDLAVLESFGSITRVQGGATVRGLPASPTFTTALSERLHHHALAKITIGVEARSWLDHGSTVFLDGSTTSLAVAVAIEADPLPLTVVTVSPLIAHGLHAPGTHVVIAPGSLDFDHRSVGGYWTTDFLRGLNYSAAFFSGAGFSLENGLTTTRRELADIVMEVRGRSARSVCLVDSSKFGTVAMVSAGSLLDFDVVVTDGDLDASRGRALVEAGVRLERPTATSRRRAADVLSESRLWQLALRSSPRPTDPVGPRDGGALSRSSSPASSRGSLASAPIDLAHPSAPDPGGG